MRDDMHRDARATDATARNAATTTGLRRLKDLDDFEVAEGDPDVRGWEVRTSDDRRIGKVEEIIVDTTAMKVRYLDVELDRKELGLREERHVLLPIGTARLDDDKDNVLVSQSSTELIGAPRYDRENLSDDYERSLRSWYGQRGTGAAASAAGTGTRRTSSARTCRGASTTAARSCGAATIAATPGSTSARI